MSHEEFHSSAMVDAVRDMARKLEQYTQHADEERKKLLESVNGTVASMRQDVHASIGSLQLNASQHRDEHTAERKERAADVIDRLNRQLVLNIWLGALTGLLIFVVVLVAVVLARLVLYAR